MAKSQHEELRQLRIGLIEGDATVARSSDEAGAWYVEGELLYHDLISGHSRQSVTEKLRHAGGQEHAAASWSVRFPTSAGKGVVDYLDHMRDDLHLEIWEFPSSDAPGGRTDIHAVAKNVQEAIGGAAAVHHVPVYTTAPVSFGPHGAPTPVSFGGDGPPEQGTALPETPNAGHPAGRGNVQLAVLDSGLPRDYAHLHPRLRDAVAPNFDVENPVDSDDDLRLDAGHGLFILDLAYRLAPSLKPVIMRRPTRNDSNLTLGEHLIALDLWEVACKAMKTGTRLIVNMSFASPMADDTAGLGLLRELTWLADQGSDVLVVAAAGNAGDNRKMFPAACDLPNVVSVGALDGRGHVASFSSRGDWVDCWTSGVAVASGYLSGVYDHPRGYKATFPKTEPWAKWSGTSFAAPRVAAAIARKAAEMPDASLLAVWETLRKQNRQHHPHWSDSSGRFSTETGVVIDDATFVAEQKG
jgi:hypothetical protein